MSKTTEGRGSAAPGAASRYHRFARADTGLFARTPVLTLMGELAAEDIRPGTRLITRDSGAARVEHVEQVTHQVRRIALAPGALGPNRPLRPVELPGDQMVLLRGPIAREVLLCECALIAARALVTEGLARDLGTAEARLFQIFCEGPHILYCGGLELSTADGALARGEVLRAA